MRSNGYALAAIALWGTLAALALQLRHIPPFFLVGVTLCIGGLVGARRLRLSALRPSVLLLGLYGLGAYHLCLFLALRLAPPVEANLLNYLWPLLIVVLSPSLVPGTKLTMRHVAGALLGFAGAALLVTGGRFGFASGFQRSHLTGYLLAFAAAVIWSTYSLMTRRLGGFPTATISAFCLLAGVVCLGCHAVFEPRYVPTLAELPWILVVGLGPMGAAFYLWDRALQHGDPRTIGTLAYLTPLLSTLLLTVVSHHPFARTTAIGMALIVGGAIIGSLPRRAGG